MSFDDGQDQARKCLSSAEPRWFAMSFKQNLHTFFPLSCSSTALFAGQPPKQ